MDERGLSRPISPASPMTSSFCDATTTIDDLTAAIADLSRIPSPDPSTTAALTCCCGKDDCDSFKSWLELRTKLNQRLVLSAEVGQALLQKHEAYVRQSERKLRNADQYSESEDSNPPQSSNESLQRDFDDLMKEKAQLEKRLNQALVNSEVTEVSSKTILQELHEARETISRLTGHHARSVGWETRLSSALRERDDMQQERDEEMHRARLAESRFAVLKEKTAKLQSEVRRLQESLEEKRLHRLESSEHLIQDARTRLESFRSSQLGITAKVAEDEITSVLESMVHDNEVLKRDNAELQHLLTESREEIHSLQEELEEQRVNPPSRMSRSGGSTPNSRHHHSGSVPVINIKDFMLSPPRRRNPSTERRRRSGQPMSLGLSTTLSEPAAPHTLSPPLSAASLTPAEYKYGQSPRPSTMSAEIDEDANNGSSPTLHEKSRGHRPLLLLARSRGVQTDITSPTVHSPTLPSSNLSTMSPHDPRSESSSVSEIPSSPLGAILERVVALFNSLAQADALTLTNRLKRQHLKGADVGHLSRSTVSNILAEVGTLRTHFRFLLEDEKIVTACTRKDLRLLFKIVKDVFHELGQLRVGMNSVILDPSSAGRVSELALNPGLVDAQKAKDNGAHSAAAWMAPISKLFLPSAIVKSDSGSSADRVSVSQSSRPTGAGPNFSRPQKLAPKLGPALGASTTTVNVEFSGTGVGRAVTSTVRLQPTVSTQESINVAASDSTGSNSALMGIFAGAQRPIVDASEPWVVLPSAPRKKPTSAVSIDNNNSPAENHHAKSSATIGRTALRRNMNRLSRNVDAVIDIVEKQPQPQEGENPGDERDGLPPLLQRTLRRRGLSDSSIHSTFSSHVDQHGPEISLPPSPQRNIPSAAAARMPAWRQPNSVFQAFSQWGVFNFRQPMPAPAAQRTTAVDKVVIEPETSSARSSIRGRRNASPSVDEGAIPRSTSAADRRTTSEHSSSSQATTTTDKATQPKSASRDGGVLPQLASWATSSMLIDPVSGSDPFIASSLRDESYMHRATAARRIGRRDDTPIGDFY